MRTVRFELLRPDEIIAERTRFPVVYQPIGPLEWHGPHLPFGMDPLHAEMEAHRVAEAIGGVVMPTLWWGTERERDPEALRSLGFKGDEWIVGMDFPANSMKSMYSPDDIFGIVVRARLDLLVRQHYRLIVIINGHGATNHLVTLGRLAAEYSAESAAQVMLITAFIPNGEDSIAHAADQETSLMMAMYPDAVDLTKLPPLPTPLKNIDWGIVDGPSFSGKPNADHTLRESNDPRRHSSPEAGEKSLSSTSKWIAEQVQSAAGKLGKGK